MTLRHVVRIARWEVARSLGHVDRTTAIVMVLAMLGIAVGGAVFVDDIDSASQGIYRVSVESDSPYYQVVRSDERFRVVSTDVEALSSGSAELAIREGRVDHANTRIGRAALTAFREAIDAFNDRRLAEESDQAAAFPVAVDLRYRERSSDGGGADAPGGGSDTGDSQTTTTPAGETSTGDGGLGIGTLLDRIRSSGRALFGAPQRGTPADITPPFPMRALLVAFAFLVPLNPIAQAYGSSMMGERIDRRGESMLVTPVGRHTIVGGKTLPYGLVAMAITAIIALVIGGGFLTVVAVLPIVAVFLGATLLAALFARSFTELSFLTLTVSVIVTAYAFVPAIFTDVHPIAGISPLSIVVRDLTGAPPELEQVAFATLPLAFVALVLFAAGTSLYREEDLFTQRPPHAKALDALATRLTLRRVPLWAALTLPFVFVAELFAVAILFIAPPTFAIPALLAAIAVIEEVAKSLPAVAGIARDRWPRGWRTALLAGAGSGIGFAIGEKAFLVAQVIGLPDLTLGRLAVPPMATGEPAVTAMLLLAPVAMHVVTATATALGASRSSAGYLVGISVAIAIHLLYNALVVSLLV